MTHAGTVTARVLVTAIAGAVVVTGAAVGSGSRATADSYTDKIAAAQGLLGADAAAAGQLAAEIAAAGDQVTAIAKAISDLDAHITAMQAQVAAAQAQLRAIEAALARRQDDLRRTQGRLAADRRQLALEMVVMYKAQQSSNTFSNLLNSGDFNSYWQHVVDVGRLNVSERVLVGTVASEAQSVQAELTAISVHKRDQARLVSTLRGMVTLLDVQLASRQQTELHLQQARAHDLQLLAINEAAQNALNAQIASLKKQEAAALAAGGGNGHFAWPERGPISQGFGCTSVDIEPYDPNCPARHFHSGIDIAAPCGNNVDAGDAGIAHTYFSDVGFGNHVIIVHGNGWVSVYGHLASFAVSDGQTVRRGQLVGYEGSTGNSTGCHLHFEVDLNGTPLNPLAYLS